jgi:hypothetical protein
MILTTGSDEIATYNLRTQIRLGLCMCIPYTQDLAMSLAVVETSVGLESIACQATLHV